ncbi:hypothetical protein IWQ56_004030 [Coemansia nantahalensis]|nr:hypothetical protein IWQ56_004030 [Coemansia nantahalensis]
MSPGSSLRRSLSTRSPSPSSLAARRLRRNASASLPLRSPGLTHILEPLGPSTGLTPVVKNMSFGTSTLPRKATPPSLSVSTPAPPTVQAPPPATAALSPPAEEPQPLQKPVFRLQKPAPPSKLSLGGRKPAPPTEAVAVQPPRQQEEEQKQQQPMLFRLQKPARPSKLAMGGRKQDVEPATPEDTVQAGPQAPQFRLLKPAPAKAPKGAKVPAKLNIGPTGLISPPETSRGGRPAPLSLALALSQPELSPSSPCMPLTPGASRGPVDGGLGASMFGEASPSFYDQPTPPPVDGAPSFMVTPPSPAVVAVAAVTGAVEPASPPPGGEQQRSAAAMPASASLAPCTPPWPKTGASLRKTIFDHIGKPQLSPFDLRGYMATSMIS